MTTELDRDEIVAQVAAKLSTRHPDLSVEEVESIAREELDAIAESPVKDFLLVLTERATKRRLKRGH